MIGKAQWFEMRKYGGWGIKPITWQGWLYVIGMQLPYLIALFLPLVPFHLGLAFGIFWLSIVALDTMDIMMHIKRDEREQAHEALAERNASWVMVGILLVGIAYQITQSIIQGVPTMDPFLPVALLAGVMAKVITFHHLQK